ncbi:pilus assembly protein [Tropicimonas sp. IMCC6043]|uniref:pilus assembly protein n=1 Tax=Tropicimonas sp. IMCC6043 TaxID=2510645 RepID=UPI00101BC5A7|nr:pilus assembly protein [Tropicimonas sp. IMCC6043]RYH12092.1 pilus assembly protein [Tropicimonas sp. IMCC6043]
MRLFKRIPAFAAEQDGAVTVDWVVLCAAIVGIALAVVSVITGGVEDLSSDISNQLAVSQIKTTF